MLKCISTSIHCLSLIVASHSVELLSHRLVVLIPRAVLCNPSLGYNPWAVACRPWEEDQGFHFDVLCNTGLWYDKNIGRGTNPVLVLSIVITSVFQQLSGGDYY